MTHEPHPHEEESSVEADERRDLQPVETSPEDPSRREIIPGNVGSLDDVPADLVEEADVVVDEGA
ncbi:MAG: hypothetical protein M3457_00040 [Chloroflexota bacterium]|nr:hypothetical protein [Chloroflexota bacterium]